MPSTSSTPTAAHFVCAGAPILSHVTPLIGLSVSLLLRFPGLVLTVFMPDDMANHARNEIAAQTHELTLEETAAFSRRLRLFVFADGLPAPDSKSETLTRMNYNVEIRCTLGFSSFHPTFDSLFNSQEVTDITGQTFSSALPPTLIITDMFAFYMSKGAFPPSVKVVNLFASISRAVDMFVAPHVHKTGVEARRIFEDATLKGERTLSEIADEVFNGLAPSPFEVVCVPGYSDICGYEMAPQNWPTAGLPLILTQAQAVFQRSDAVIVLSSPFLEPETIPWLHSYLETKIIPILPRIAPAGVSPSSAGPQTPASVDRSRVLAFLEGKPPNSVLYISWGSLFHASVTSPEYYRALVETLLDEEQPWSFVLAKGSPTAALPEDLIEQIEKSGKGMYVGWAPQREALAHKAVGLMISHGGSGGTYEALTSSVPLLFWPMAGDQPAMAQLFCSPLHAVGLELIQVRTGVGAGDSLPHGKIHGTVDAVKAEVREKLARFWGEEGAGFRKRAGELGVKLISAGKPGGESYEALGEFERYF